MDNAVKSNEEEWKLDVSLGPVLCIDGQKRQGPVARRKNDAGKWEYRELTDDEMTEWNSRMAW